MKMTEEMMKQNILLSFNQVAWTLTLFAISCAILFI
jgi:hypothetical protein